MVESKVAFPIRTERLTLRPFEAADFEALWSVYRDPDVVRYLYTGAWTQSSAREAFAKKSAARTWRSEGDVLVLAEEWKDAAAGRRERG